jgi:hypothetical protein
MFYLYGNVTIAGEGLKNLDLCSALRALSRGGGDFYLATPAVIRDLGFFWSHPFSRLLRHTRGCGGSILTRNLTGPHSVASYATLSMEKTIVFNINKCEYGFPHCGPSRPPWTISEQTLMYINYVRKFSCKFELLWFSCS